MAQSHWTEFRSRTTTVHTDGATIRVNHTYAGVFGLLDGTLKILSSAREGAGER